MAAIFPFLKNLYSCGQTRFDCQTGFDDLHVDQSGTELTFVEVTASVSSEVAEYQQRRDAAVALAIRPNPDADVNTEAERKGLPKARAAIQKCLANAFANPMWRMYQKPSVTDTPDEPDDEWCCVDFVPEDLLNLRKDFELVEMTFHDARRMFTDISSIVTITDDEMRSYQSWCENINCYFNPTQFESANDSYVRFTLAQDIDPANAELYRVEYKEHLLNITQNKAVAKSIIDQIMRLHADIANRITLE